MKNKILLILILSMFLISLNFVSAEIPTFQQDEQINYSFLCFDTSNDYCTAGTQCMITITNPNGNSAYINESMTYYNPEFRFILPTANLGTYESIISCQGSSNAISEWEYKITPSGFPLMQGENAFHIILLIVGFLFFLFFGYLSIKVPWKNEFDEKGLMTKVTHHKYLKLFSILFCYASFLFFLSILSSVTLNFINLDYTKTMIVRFYLVFNALRVPVTFLIFGIIFIKAWKDIIFNKAIKEMGYAIVGGNV